MKKVLVFSRDPGGANAVIPLVRALVENGYKVALFGKDMALNKYEKAGLLSINIMNHIQDITASAMLEFLRFQVPDVVITGTSADDMTEKLLWKAAERCGIPSMAILDQWMNYGIRFSKYSVAEIEQYYEQKNHEYLPSKILVMDALAKTMAVEDGLDASRILVVGHPHFGAISKTVKLISKIRQEGIREQLSVHKDGYLITFASEPISEAYNEADATEHHWGYTERTILRQLLDSLSRITKMDGKRLHLIVRPHPRENKESLVNMVERYHGSGFTITVNNDVDSLELIAVSDLVCGMSSMFLLEAAIAGKQILSIQIGLKRDNPFVLDKTGLSKSVLSPNELDNVLKRIIVDNVRDKINFQFEPDAISNIINAMELLCRN